MRAFVARNGVSPTFSEIAEAMGIVAKSGAHRVVHKLVERGMIHFDPRRPRGITLVDELLSPAQERCIADLTRRTGKSRADLIREAVDSLIERELAVEQVD
jgi:SOS-response transcriptional repressor LexA